MLVDNDNIDSLEIGENCRFEWICIGYYSIMPNTYTGF